MKSLFLPKYERNILKISALASTKWLNQKIYYTNYVKQPIISMYNKVPLFFWFDLSLEARAEILEIISYVFWKKR